MSGFNPRTLINLHNALCARSAVHILTLCAEAGSWPATVYKAVALGYVKRVDVGMFAGTMKLENYVHFQEWRNR